MTLRQFEKILTDLDKAWRQADDAGRLPNVGLERAVEIKRLANVISKARNDLRLMYYEFENIADKPKTTKAIQNFLDYTNEN